MTLGESFSTPPSTEGWRHYTTFEDNSKENQSMAILEKFFGPSIKGLAEKGDVDGIMQALSHKNTSVRRKAAIALGRSKDSRAVDKLILVLDDGDWEIRQAALDALGEIGSSKAVDPVIRALTQRNQSVSSTFVEMLKPHLKMSQLTAGQWMGFVGTVESHLSPLQAKERNVQQAAAKALGRFKDPRALKPLTTLLLTKLLWHCRTQHFRHVQSGLEYLKTEDVITVLQEEDELCRYALGLGIGKLLSLPDQLLMNTKAFSRLSANSVSYVLEKLQAQYPGKSSLAEKGHGLLASIILVIKHASVLQTDIEAKEDALAKTGMRWIYRDFDLLLAVIHAIGNLGDLRAIEPLTVALNKCTPVERLGFIAKACSEALDHIGGPKKQQEATFQASPTCTRCKKNLARVDMSRGAVTIGGPLPTLYCGVVCESCRKVECEDCKGANLAAPCSWCGNPVSPAYEHLLH
jgi:HEAT repeat protein